MSSTLHATGFHTPKILRRNRSKARNDSERRCRPPPVSGKSKVLPGGQVVRIRSGRALYFWAERAGTQPKTFRTGLPKRSLASKCHEAFAAADESDQSAGAMGEPLPGIDLSSLRGAGKLGISRRTGRACRESERTLSRPVALGTRGLSPRQGQGEMLLSIHALPRCAECPGHWGREHALTVGVRQTNPT